MPPALPPRTPHPPPPPLGPDASKSAIPALWGGIGRLSPQQLEEARAALAQLMEEGGKFEEAVTDAILLILQAMFLLREGARQSGCA